jgi:hypothetical protein
VQHPVPENGRAIGHDDLVVVSPLEPKPPPVAISPGAQYSATVFVLLLSKLE